MIKSAFIILFAIFSNAIVAQTIDDLKGNLEKNDFQKFKYFVESIKPSDHCAPAEEMTYREIIRDYNEAVVGVLLFVPTPNGKYAGECNFYQINLVVKINQIIKYELYSKNFNDNNHGNYRLLMAYANDEEIKTFYDLYEKRFYRKLNPNELFDNSATYGRQCGITGGAPEDREMIEKYIESENREMLFYWLTSPSFEKKLYGYEGYGALIKNGYILTEKEIEVISDLEYFKGPVRTCSGCSFMSVEFAGIINRIGRMKRIRSIPKKEIVNNIEIWGNIKNPTSTTNKILLVGLPLLLIIGLIYKARNRKTASHE